MEIQTKEGRTFSSRNMASIKNAMTMLLGAVQTIKDMLSTGEPMEEMDMETDKEVSVVAPETTTQVQKAILLSQSEAAYNPVGGTEERACFNCRFFCRTEGESYCTIVENYPAPIVAGGISSWHAPIPMAEEVESEPIPVIVVEPIEIEISMENSARADNDKRGLIDSLKAMFTRKELPAPFSVVGDFWVAWWTNNFEDLEQDIFSNVAHERYLGRVEKNLVPLPELWFWHIKGSRHGQALWLGKDDLGDGRSIMMAVGKFDDSAIGQTFKKYYSKSKMAVSHGAVVSKGMMRTEGDLTIYDDYNTFEISPLPIGKEANPYTHFQEIPMLTDEKWAELQKAVGKDNADLIKTANEAFRQEIGKEAADVRFKSLVDVVSVPAEEETKSKEAIGALLSDMVKDQAGMAVTMIELKKSYDAKVADLEKTVANLVARLDKELSPPASPVTAAPTTTLSKEAVAEILKASQTPADIDPFFAAFNGGAK